MHIVHVSAEMAPLAKVGGLGDAVRGLTKELSKNHKVSVILPKYSFISETAFPMKLEMQFSCERKRISYDVRIFSTEIDQIPVYLIETSPLLDYFQEGSLYLGTKKDIHRFMYFCKACAEYLIRKNQEISVLHLHDWHTALLAPLVKEVYLSLKVLIQSVVFSVHNLAYAGHFLPQDLMDIQYPLEDISSFKEKRLFFSYYTLIRGALKRADKIVPVSPGYAKEILTKKYACGFLSLLQEREKAIQGILNGIDEDLWNPEKDPHIPHHFSKKESVEEILLAKKKNKEALQARLGLKQGDYPLFISIGRLVDQKNPYLMKKGLFYAKKQGAQGVLLGTSPIERTQKAFSKLKELHQTDPEIRFITKYDEPLSRQMYAAADFFLMPSNFEPCGLTQLIALRYGCIPIVRAVGGLKDTVFDARETPQTKANGFSFKKPYAKSLESAMKRALNNWDIDRCKTLVENGIKEDYSWKNPAENYLAVYQSFLQI